MSIGIRFYGSPCLAMLAALALAGCGDTSAPASATVSLASVSMAIDAPAESIPEIEAAPTFHIAPVVLDEPADLDALDPNATAEAAPHSQTVPAGLSSLSTRQLTLKTLVDAADGKPALQLMKSGETATPMATGTQVVTYTPAQIRAAYGLAALPAVNSTPTAAQAAQLGAGQTIYIVNANHDPNIALELAAFNQKFGLPNCVTTTIAPTAALPLPPAPLTGCTLSIVYNTSAGAMTSTVPAYDAGWATEIALDVQWAHAIAPLARIVLIEAPDASINSLIGSIALANRMGPGVVSMSFGANEGSWTSQFDANFTAANMTYLAATGDSGAAVSWPSVSTNVLAVGGTSLSYAAGLPRAETTWSGTGGSISQYIAAPAYQNSVVPGMLAYGRRAVADVAFNADPATGQYVAIINPGTVTPGWVSAGGTSLATPQWAGVIAIANALRAQAAKSALGQPHGLLYGAVASTRTIYASAFADIVTGTNGSCATCIAKIGYDTPTGLGTPNVTSLLTSLSGASLTTSTAPVVKSASISGTAATPLAFTVAVSAPGAVTFSMSGAPAGMSIGTTGVVSWANPIAGSYAVTITARDPQTGLSGLGVYTVSIAALQPPVVTGATIKGVAGTALSFNVTVNSTRALKYSLSGAPSGMVVNTSGVVSWPTPIAGTFAVTAKATDTATGLAGSGLYTVSIAAPSPPVVASGTSNGVVGAALSFSVAVTAQNTVSFALSGAPAGMTIASTGIVSWPTPVAGSYTVKVIASDTRTGLIGSGSYAITIAPAGPVIKTTAMSGTSGKPMSGTITITDATSSSIAITISGVPMGMAFSISGSVITASWASPVAGNYSLQIQARDGNGRTASATMPVTVTR